MNKSGIEIDIPGLGRRAIKTILTDFTGTLSCGGKLVPGVKERLLELRDLVDLHILTSDTFHTAEEELRGIVPPHILQGKRHDTEKEEYLRSFAPEHTAVLGNGNNDRLLLERVKQAGGLAIAVDNGEGCALDALLHADVFITGAANALDLLLHPDRCKATLRF